MRPYLVGIALALMAVPVGRAEVLINHARTGTATASSTGFGGLPSRGIDGNTSGNYGDNSTTHTATANDNEWWEVDLGSVKAIGHVHVWFREDCCYDRNHPTRIVVYDSADVATRVELFSHVFDTQPPRDVGVNISPIVNGRVVRVEHPVGTAQFVSLAEVEVFNQPIEDLFNYALASNGGTATGTPEGIVGSVAANTINGDHNISVNGTVYRSLTDPAAFIQVDLGGEKNVGRVQIWGRRPVDATIPPRFVGQILTVLDGSANTLFQETLPQPDTREPYGVNFSPPLANAKVVQISYAPGAPNPTLTLSEIEALAPHAASPAITFLQNLTAPAPLLENQSAALGPVSVSVDGGVRPGEVTYRWYRNGAPVTDAHGSMFSSYATPPLVLANDGDRYKVEVLVSGSSVFSSEVQVRVVTDNVPPTVSSIAFGSTFELRATLTFSELLEAASAGTLANYVFAGGAGAASAALQADGRTVVLVVTNLCENANYDLAVSGVRDVAGNTMAPASLTGNVGFYQINHSRGGIASASSTGFGAPPERAIDGNTDGNFGGNSVFHSADNAPEEPRYFEVDLGSVKPIGRLSYWRRTDCCGERDTDYVLVVYDGADPSNEVYRVQYPGLPPPNSAFNLVPAVNGRYVRWEPNYAGNRNFQLAELEAIAPYQCVSIVVTQSPPNRTVSENATPTLSAGARVAGGPQSELNIQWQRSDGVGGYTNIPGATALSYTTPPLTLADSGVQFRALFSLSGLAQISEASTITVVNDNIKPTVERVSFAEAPDGNTKIILHYSELMKLDTIQDIFNYDLNAGLTKLGSELGADGKSVALIVGGLPDQLGVYCVTVHDVTDLAENTIDQITLSGIVPFSGVNAALTSTVTASSTGFGAPPERAIDGNTDGAFGGNSVFHSGEGAPEQIRFLEVDLGLEQPVARIQVWYRTDCCPERNDNATVKALAEDRSVRFSNTYAGRPPANVDYILDSPVSARFVRWEPGEPPAGGARDFHIAELQVFTGFPPLKLTIEPQGANVGISWAGTVQGFTLQQSDTLPGSWTPTPGVAANSVIIPADQAKRFYRLEKD